MKVVVGLGNPGSEYQKTRHNVGEHFLRELAQEWSGDDFTELKTADYSTAKVGREKAALIFPNRFMNNSGPALKRALADLKIKPKPNDLLVMHDDLDIGFGKIKMSFARSSGGHKGVESVIKALKTDKFWRLRVGIAPKKKPDRKKTVDFLLKKFSPAEEKAVNKNLKKVASALTTWLTNPERAMSILNSGGLN